MNQRRDLLAWLHAESSGIRIGRRGLGDAELLALLEAGAGHHVEQRSRPGVRPLRHRRRADEIGEDYCRRPHPAASARWGGLRGDQSRGLVCTRQSL